MVATRHASKGVEPGLSLGHAVYGLGSHRPDQLVLEIGYAREEAEEIGGLVGGDRNGIAVAFDEHEARRHVQVTPSLIDQAIRPAQDGWRKRQPELSRRIRVDDQFRPLDDCHG